MEETSNIPRDATVSDTVERIRAARFPDLDRALVLEMMSLHAAGATPENMARMVDQAIMSQVKEPG